MSYNTAWKNLKQVRTKLNVSWDVLSKYRRVVQRLNLIWKRLLAF